MCRNRPATSRRRATSRLQRGFAIVSAIFLLLLLAALGAFMITMSMVQHATSAQDVQGSRAYQAARAGIEWGVYQIMIPENATPPTAQANCFALPPEGLVLGGTLSGFTVNVTCVRSLPQIEGGNTVFVYNLASTATFGAAGTSGYAERRISATVATCRTPDSEKC
jgi:MSHA biogenesis protein MshP